MGFGRSQMIGIDSYDKLWYLKDQCLISDTNEYICLYLYSKRMLYMFLNFDMIHIFEISSPEKMVSCKTPDTW